MTRPCRVMDRRVSCPGWMFWIACCGGSGRLLGFGSIVRPGRRNPPSRASSSRSARLGDPAILAGLSAERGEWMASRGGEITIQEQPLPGPDQLSEVDLLIFPGQELGSLVDADALETIPNSVVLARRESPTNRSRGT